MYFSFSQWQLPERLNWSTMPHSSQRWHLRRQTSIKKLVSTCDFIGDAQYDAHTGAILGQVKLWSTISRKCISFVLQISALHGDKTLQKECKCVCVFKLQSFNQQNDVQLLNNITHNEQQYLWHLCKTGIESSESLINSNVETVRNIGFLMVQGPWTLTWEGMIIYIIYIPVTFVFTVP